MKIYIQDKHFLNANTQIKHNLEPEDEQYMYHYECSFVFHNHVIIITEMLHLSLFHIIKERKFNGLGLDLIQSVLSDTLKPLSILHRMGLVHCDVKPENILQVNISSRHVKLIDFGCCSFPQEYQGTLQTPLYRAPEVILHLPYDSKIDIWSVGCVAAELMLGLPIFYATVDTNLLYLQNLRIGPVPERMIEMSPYKDIYFTKEGELKTKEELETINGAPFENQKPIFIDERLETIISNYPLPMGSSEDFAKKEIPRRQIFLDLLKKLLTIDPNERMTAEEALQHPFFSLEM